MSTPVVVLVGPPVSGKTTVGTAVADALGVAFRDTDADVEADAGSSVADLFVTAGEPHFRTLEQAAVARAMAEHHGVRDRRPHRGLPGGRRADQDEQWGHRYGRASR